MPVNDLYAGTTRPSQCVPSAQATESQNKNRKTRRVGTVFGLYPMRGSLVRPLSTRLQLGSRTPGVAALAESDEDRTGTH